MSRPITGPALDDLTAEWINGDIPADSYLKQARRLARESARRDITKQDSRRMNGAATANRGTARHSQ
ncbi:MAG TPA: hypothetical protein VIU11_24010 [Nakamurella sp.]